MKKDRIIKSLIVLMGWVCCSLFFGTTVMAQGTGTGTDAVGVAYRGHIQDYGNRPVGEAWVTGDAQLGTTGESKRIEGFWIKLTGTENLPEGAGIRYNVHVQNVGWLASTDLAKSEIWVANGDFAGSQSKSQRVEAIQIVLTGADGKALPGYSVQYKVHGQDYGWSQGWKADGAIAGSVGESRRLEAIQIKIVKTATDPVEDEPAIYDKAGTNGPATGTKTIAGDVIVAADGVVLQNLVIQGDLTISEKVGDGNVTLNNVTVKGNTFVRGGGKNSIHINGGSYQNIVIEKTATGTVRIVATDADGLDVVISEDATGETVILEGAFDSVAVNAPNMTVTTQGDTTIAKMAVSEAGAGSTLNLGAQTTVDGLELDAKTSVAGQGTVKEADIKSDGVSFEKAPVQQTVAPEVTVPPVVTPVVPPVVPPTPGGGGSGGYTPPVPVAVTGVSLTPALATVELTQNVQLTAMVTPSNATDKKLIWTSDKPEIATVDATGKVTGVKEGTATITATSSDDATKKASCTVTVTAGFKVTKDADGNGTITGMNGSETSITIPAVIDGVTITAIGNSAFESGNLTSITIPNTVTAIGKQAFAGCNNLNTVIFAAGSTLTTIGANAFNNAGLSNGLTLPDSVTSIGDGAFAYSKLPTISLPAGLTSLSGNLFKSCESLTTITLPGSLTTIGNNAFYGCQKLTGIAIPDGVTAIPEGAFDGCWALASVQLPSGLKTIGTHGFQRCKALTTLTLPASLVSIGMEAFSVVGTPTEGTNSSLVMTFEGNAPVLPSDAGQTIPTGTTIQYYAGCTGFDKDPWNDTNRYTLTPLNPKTITNTDIKGVTIPFNGETPVKVITADPQYTCTVSWTKTGSEASFTGAFDGNSYYTAAITLTPTNGYTAKDVTFTVDGASQISAQTVNTDGTATIKADFRPIDQFKINASGVITAYSGRGSDLTIPDKVGETTVTVIGDNAFELNTNLTNISLPASVKTIGARAFYYCNSLTTVTFAGTASLESIGVEAFAGCGQLKTFELPASLTAIGQRAFSGCNKLVTVTIPAGVTSIGADAFALETTIKPLPTNRTFTFLGNVPTAIGTDAIPKSDAETTTTIQYYAGSTGFNAAPWNESANYTLKRLDRMVTHTALTGLTAPSVGAAPVVTPIADEQYTGSVNWVGGPTTAFSGSSPYTAIIVLNAQNGYVFPAGFSFSVDDPGASTSTSVTADGKTATVTVCFALPTTGQYCIDKAGTITTYYGPGRDVTIPDQVGETTVTGIGATAFAGNTELVDITLPATVTTIADGAFTGCTNLKLMIFRGNAPQVGTEVAAKTATIPATAEIRYYSNKTGFEADKWTGYTLTPILAAPSGLNTSNLASDSVTLNWTGAVGATGYQVYCGTAADSIKSLVGNISGASYDVTGLTAGQTYYFTVIASDSFGSSLPSAPVPVTTLAN